MSPKPPMYLLEDNEVGILDEALKQHSFPTAPLPAECGGPNCDIVCPDVEGYVEHLQVVAFVAGLRCQGTPPAGSSIVWLCPEPDCRERISVEDVVLENRLDEVSVVIESVKTAHMTERHGYVAPSPLVVPSRLILP